MLDGLFRSRRDASYARNIYNRCHWDRQKLLWREPSPPTRSDELLFAAAAQGDLTKVQRLLAEGAKLDATDTGGWDALVHAVAGGNPSMVRFPLKSGADPRRKDAEGRTASQLAREFLFTAVWDLLEQAEVSAP